eukprot:6729310-Lingulodinium_polyedra.AAC.1
MKVARSLRPEPGCWAFLVVAVALSPVRAPGVAAPATRGKTFLAGEPPCFAAPRWRAQSPGSKQSNVS